MYFPSDRLYFFNGRIKFPWLVDMIQFQPNNNQNKSWLNSNKILQISWYFPKQWWWITQRFRVHKLLAIIYQIFEVSCKKFGDSCNKASSQKSNTMGSIPHLETGISTSLPNYKGKQLSTHSPTRFESTGYGCFQYRCLFCQPELLRSLQHKTTSLRFNQKYSS